VKCKSNLILALAFAALSFSCQSGRCKERVTPSNTESALMDANQKPVNQVLDRVKVYKYDGSLQCNMGKAISVDEMEKQLKDIKVFARENKSDGMMRIQLCGSPTGRANVYEIERKDIEAAKKAGFQEWTFE
jgi:hypothetical protein